MQYYVDMNVGPRRNDNTMHGRVEYVKMAVDCGVTWKYICYKRVHKWTSSSIFQVQEKGHRHKVKMKEKSITHSVEWRRCDKALFFNSEVELLN